MQTETELTTKEKARLMRNAYQRQWAHKNKDRIKGYMEKHYAKKYDEMMVSQILEEFTEDTERGDLL